MAIPEKSPVPRKGPLPIGYRLVPVGAAEYPGADGQVWAEADIVLGQARNACEGAKLATKELYGS